MLGWLFRWLSPTPAPRSSTVSTTGAGTPYAASIRKAERDILALVQKHCPRATVFSFGAVEIDPKHLAIWITTPTDRERDRLKSSKSLDAACRDALAAAGYPADAVPLAGFAFESEETVNRVHGGNWWHAVK